MDKYEQMTVVGEGSYGLVMKCRHKETDQIVAIKKFLETEEDATIRKMALREIRMLKRLKHENLVTMIEVFRHRKRFFLVFEFLEGTVLDELEKMPSGLGEERCRERIFQVTRAINYCHCNNIIHRDVKPENVLVSSMGVVKLCDFGFARLVCISGEPCTEYVATRWYRAPELLVGEVNYGAPVDIWAIGCLFAEMMTGDPLFPGESDIDQLYLIVNMLGKPCQRHQNLMSRSSNLRGMIKSANSDKDLYKQFTDWSLFALDFVSKCMKMDPHERATSDDLLKNNFFIHDRFPQKFLPNLREKVNSEFNTNPLLRKYKTEILMSTDKKDEIKVKKLTHNDVRWKFTMTEGSVKRKFNYDIFNEHENNKNLISLAKSSQRLSVVPKSGQKAKPDDSDSLVPTQMFSDLNKSPNVLHPSINNISFNRDPPKKSPNLLQSLSKSNLSQAPLLSHPRNQFFKKLETAGNLETSWVGFSKNKKEQKSRHDVLTLPSLPGATQSPNKNFKAKNLEVTPAYRYQKAKRKLNILDITLPVSVKDKDGF